MSYKNILIFLLLILISKFKSFPFQIKEVKPYEQVEVQLKQEGSSYQVLKFKNSYKNGDIVILPNEVLSNVKLCIYNSEESIVFIDEEKPDFINCTEEITAKKDNISITENSPAYVQNDYIYIAIVRIDLIFGAIFSFFNENDIKEIMPNTKNTLKYLYSKKELTCSYTLNQSSSFAFFLKDSETYYSKFEYCIEIYDNTSQTLVKNITNITDKVYHYEQYYNESYNSMYYIIFKTNNTEFAINIDFVIDNIFSKPIKMEYNATYKNAFIPSLNYTYYIDITDYSIEEENLLEILPNDNNYLNKTIAFNTLSKTIDFKEDDIKFKNYTRTKRGSDDKNFYIPFKKEKMNDNYFLLKIRIEDINSYHEMTINSLPKVKTFNLSESVFEYNVYTINDIKIYSKIPHLIKFQYNQKLNEDFNLVFKVLNDRISSFTKDTLLTGENEPNEHYLSNSIFILKKNEKLLSNTIYINLQGNIGSTSIKVGLVESEILLVENQRKLNQPYIFSLTNCKEKSYLVRTYDDNSIGGIFTLIIKKFYGQSELSYASKINEPDFSDLSVETIEDEIYEIEANNDLLRLRCSKPSSYLLTFISAPESLFYLEDGAEEYIKVSSNRNSITLEVRDEKKMYQLQIQYYGHGTKVIYDFGSNQGVLDDYNKTQTWTFSSQNDLIMTIRTDKEGEFAYIRLSLSSWNSYYKIVEGNTDIPIDGKRSLLKIRNDFYYDNIQINFITKKSIQNFNLAYSMNNYKDQNYIPYPKHLEYFKSEIIFRYPNPYNKYYSYIDKEDFYYFAVDFLSQKQEDYFIFAEIRYNDLDNSNLTTNNSTIICYNNSRYRIQGEDNYKSKNRLVFNINKCTDNPVTFKNYFESDNNLIEQKELTQTRNLFDIENNYNGSKFLVNGTDNLTACVNYFYINHNSLYEFNFTSKYKISYSNNKLKWNSFQVEGPEAPTLYSIYLLPVDSEANDNMCLLSLIKSNFSTRIEKIGGTSEYDLTNRVKPGKYRVNIIAKSLSNLCPITTIYDSTDISINRKTNKKFWIFASIVFIFVFILGAFYLYREYKKKKNKNGINSVEGAKKLLRDNSIGSLIANGEMEQIDRINYIS